MFKSVFAKYTVAFTLITIISFVLMAAVITSMISNYAEEEQWNSITESAESLKNYFDYAILKDKATSLENYATANENQLYLTCKYMQSAASSGDGKTIILFNENGEVFAVSDADGSKIKEALYVLVDDAGFFGKIDEETSVGTDVLNVLFPDKDISQTDDTLKRTFSGKTTVDGVFDEPVTAYGVLIEDYAKNPVGAALVCTISESVDVLLDSMTKTIVMAILWVMFAALIAVYLISNRITGPIKEMSRAAKSFAVGKFDVRVPVKGNDEVAELALAFNNMAQSLESLENMRNSFMANVSHDLRTPMTTIAGFIDNILIGAIPPEKQGYYLGIIKDEVTRLSRLVSTLLDLSRLQAGDRKFTMKKFDICEKSRQILIAFEQKIDAKHLDVEFECDEDRINVLADTDAIHQVLYNLCDNAIKFSAEGGKLRVSIKRKPEDTSKVLVTVFNEGVGIAPEDIPLVFERFYKTDKSRGLDKSGVGLGLFISKTIMNAHGETIFVESEYGKNCLFGITLKTVG